MEIYLVITEDRHCDVDVEPFYNSDKAVTRAREIAQESTTRTEDYQESSMDDWLFYATYSCEGDSVHVVSVEMQDSP